MVTTAESCTGGMVAAAITDVAGSSAVFDRGFVTYSNAAKMRMLGVPEELLNTVGAVSREVAQAMALGAIAHSDAQLAVSITGVAGPGGGTKLKPVGLVYFACAVAGGEVKVVERRFLDMTRAEVRQASTQQALQLLWDALPG